MNVALDTALQRLEEGDPQLKGCVVKGTFIARNLAPNDIKKLWMRLIKLDTRHSARRKILLVVHMNTFLMNNKDYNHEKSISGILVSISMNKIKQLAR